MIRTSLLRYLGMSALFGGFAFFFPEQSRVAADNIHVNVEFCQQRNNVQAGTELTRELLRLQKLIEQMQMNQVGQDCKQGQKKGGNGGGGDAKGKGGSELTQGGGGGGKGKGGGGAGKGGGGKAKGGKGGNDLMQAGAKGGGGKAKGGKEQGITPVHQPEQRPKQMPQCCCCNPQMQAANIVGARGGQTRQQPKNLLDQKKKK